MSQQSGEMSATYGPTMLRYVAIVWSGLKDDDWEFQGGGVQKTRVPLKKTCKSKLEYPVQLVSGGIQLVQNQTSFLGGDGILWKRWHFLCENHFPV